MSNRRDAVRNEKRRATLHHALQLAQNLLFGVGVDTSECIVQDQYSRVADNRAGNRRALLLAAGESNPALADHRRQTGRELFKFAPYMRRLSRLEHLRLAGPRSTKRNISAN